MAELGLAALEVVVSSTLLTAAISKVLDPAAWRASLGRYRIEALRRPWLATAVPVAEASAAILVVLDLRPLGPALATLLFAAFSATLVVAIRRGATGECGCFGELVDAKIGPGAAARAGVGSVLSLAIVAVPASIERPLVQLAIVAAIVAALQLLTQVLRLRRPSA